MSRVNRLLVASALVTIGILWRLPTEPREWGMLRYDPDSLFHLHRVARCLSHYPTVESIDAYSHYPQGFRIHWLAPLTLGYATVARVVGGAGEDLTRLQAVLSWIPPLFGVVSVLLGMVIARRWVEGEWASTAAGALIAFGSPCCRPFFFGLIDHHLYTHLGLMVLVLARELRSWGFWTAGLFFVFATTPEATFYVAFLLVILAASEALPTPSKPRAEALAQLPAWLLAPAAAAAAALMVSHLIEDQPLPWGDLSWFYLTPFQPAVLGLLGAGLLGVVSCFEAPVTQLAPRRKAGAIWLVMLSLLSLALLFGMIPGSVAEIGSKVFKADRIFVAEEQLGIEGWVASPWMRVLSIFALLAVGRTLLGLRSGYSRDGWFRWLTSTAALLLGFAQVRHLYIVSGLQMVGVVLVADWAVRAVRVLPLFAEARGLRFAVLLAVGVIALPFLWDNLRGPAASHGVASPSAAIVEEAARWLSTATPPPAPEEGRGATYAVVAPWGIGHHVHVLGRRPVVVDPFNYQYDASHEMSAVLREIWWSRTVSELERAMRHYGGRYLVLFDPARDIVGLLGGDPVRQRELLEMAPGHATVYHPAISAFAAFRLFMRRGFSSEAGHLQPRFFSREADVYGVAGGESSATLRVPKLQIYELKLGATIVGRSIGSDRFVTIHRVLRWPDGSREVVTSQVAVERDGRFRFETALPAPAEGIGFAVEGGYEIRSGAQEAVVEVTQAMVDEGAAVETRWLTARESPAAAPAT